MSRNIFHKMQSQIFRVWKHFRFLDYHDVSNLIVSLTSDIEQSGYSPDVIVSISSGGDYPAEKLSENLNVDFIKMQITHYSLNICNIEFDEIVGIYTLTKSLGYKPEIKLIKDISLKNVEGKRVLIIDDDSYSGKTLDVAKESINEKSPLEMKIGVLHTYQENEIVDFAGNWLPKKEYYNAKYRFPWSKISPHYLENSKGPIDKAVFKFNNI